MVFNTLLWYKKYEQQKQTKKPRHPGNVRTQWGITAYPGTGQQYANVKRLNPTEAPAPPVLRQEIIDMRRRAVGLNRRLLRPTDTPLVLSNVGMALNRPSNFPLQPTTSII